MYECFNCGQRTVIWDSDYDFQDYGLEDEGIVHQCHCEHCGAKILYFVYADCDEQGGDCGKNRLD